MEIPSTAPTEPQAGSAAWQIPPLSNDDRLVGGVSAGLARELNVGVLAVRASFIVLTMAGGWGLVLYGLAWLAMFRRAPDRYQPVPKAASRTHSHIALGLIIIGTLLLLRTLGFGFVDEIVFPVGFVLTGLLIAWSRGRQERGISAALRIAAGVVVAALGMFAVAAGQVNSWDSIRILGIVAAIIVGLGLVLGPSLARIGFDLDDERQERARADERAKVAAHLHDSVLQTLMLIQRHSGDPNRVAQIARQQERDLRLWLYEPETLQPNSTHLSPALSAMATQVEASHNIRVEVVTVGDRVDIDRATLESLIGATREAVTNAAKHAGVQHVDVFAERDGDRVDVFIRDSGVGFDPSDVADDRLGIRQSITARMERLGGHARVVSTPGEGTEVELSLPLDPDSQIADSHSTSDQVPAPPESETFA